jgi:hypothetical protein
MNSKRYLIVKDGKIMLFWVKACAELFANGVDVKELIYDADTQNYVERV